MLRLLPQILKSIGYYEKHGIKNLKYEQFSFAFGPFTGKKFVRSCFFFAKFLPFAAGRLAYREMDAADGALYCMKHIEFLVSAVSIERGIDNPKNSWIIVVMLPKSSTLTARMECRYRSARASVTMTKRGKLQSHSFSMKKIRRVQVLWL